MRSCHCHEDGFEDICVTHSSRYEDEVVGDLGAAVNDDVVIPAVNDDAVNPAVNDDFVDPAEKDDVDDHGGEDDRNQ